MKIVLILPLFVLILGCSKKKISIINNSHDLQTIDLSQINEVDSSIIDSISYVTLETEDNCLIGSIDKILYFDNKFYIFDGAKTKTLFVFNFNGSFLWKICQIGQGPGEYLEPLDFDIDTSGNIYILDNANMKLNKYNRHGLFLHDYKLDIRLMEFRIINNEEFIAHRVIKNGKQILTLGTYNLLNKKLTTIIESRNLFDDIDLMNLHRYSLCKSNSTTYFSPRFTNNIYEISDQSSDLVKTFILTGYELPSQDYIFKIKTDPNLVFQDNKYLLDVSDIYETSNHITITYHKQFPWKIIINKKSNTCFKMFVFNDSRYFGDNMIHGVAKNEFISILNSDNIKTDNWDDKLSISSLDKLTKEKLIGLQTISNPVLVLLRFKEF